MEIYDGETFGPVTIASYQRYKFRLYRIGYTITRNIYLRSGATLHEVVGEIKAINHRLLEWEKCIPRELRLKCLGNEATDHSTQRTIRAFQLQALALQLSYDNIQLVLHRPLLTINRIPRLPAPATAESSQVVRETRADGVDDMVKISKYQCWVSSMRTSKIGEHGIILAASQNTHGAAYAGIQTFTAGVVLGIFALSDPLSEQAHQAKRAMGRIIRQPRLHRFRTTVSDQCGAILEELIRLALAEEMKALLTEGETSVTDTAAKAFQAELNNGHTASNANLDCAEPRQGMDFDEDSIVVSGSAEGLGESQAGSFPYQTFELPRDIADGNFSEALVSLQDGKPNAMTSLVFIF